MRTLCAFALIVTLSSPPALAEGEDTKSLMAQGAELFMRGLLQEMEPAIQDFADLAQEMGPALQEFTQTMGPALHDILGKIDDFTLYEAPELLPNGDIIIRRKTDAPPLGEIEI